MLKKLNYPYWQYGLIPCFPRLYATTTIAQKNLKKNLNFLNIAVIYV
jgi:mannose/fructose/N-acetylgalactosamine-specific phosphotransferase system component IID